MHRYAWVVILNREQLGVMYGVWRVFVAELVEGKEERSLGGAVARRGDMVFPAVIHCDINIAIEKTVVLDDIAAAAA